MRKDPPTDHPSEVRCSLAPAQGSPCPRATRGLLDAVSVVRVDEPGRQLRSHAWQHVDGSSEPSAFAAYLDQFDVALRAGRMESVVLLGLGPGRAALDVGCGTGAVVVDIADVVGSDGRAVGVDVSETMIATARARAEAQGAAVELVVGDTHALDFPDGTFDAVHCDRVLQHLDDPERAIAEMARVLVPGGRLVINEPDWDGLFVDGDDVAVTHAVRDALVEHIRQPHVGRRLRRLALAAGLDVVDFHGALGVYAVTRAAADAMWSLHVQLDRAVTTGAVDRASADAWWEQLGVLDAAGQFFAGVVGFRIVARKPTPTSGFDDAVDD